MFPNFRWSSLQGMEMKCIYGFDYLEVWKCILIKKYSNEKLKENKI